MYHVKWLKWLFSEKFNYMFVSWPCYPQEDISMTLVENPILKKLHLGEPTSVKIREIYPKVVT